MHDQTPLGKGRMTLLDSALAYAARGLAVFPCIENGKRPACSNGIKDATTDPERIRALWAGNHNYNIGADPNSIGCFVVDTDPPLGDDELASLELSEGCLPTTLTYRSPRGGHHYWFKGSCPSSVRKLGKHIDTRGDGTGYVLMSPSHTEDGSYESLQNQTPSPGPGWIAGSLLRSERPQRVAEGSVEIDSAGSIALARTLLSHHTERDLVAVAGQGGNDFTYRLASRLISDGLSAAKTFQLLEEDWNPHCIPPWSTEDLATIVQHAAEYMQNDAGATALPPAGEMFAEFLSANCIQISDTERPRYWAHDVEEQDKIQEPTWLLPGLLPAQGTVILYGPPKHYKTFLALDLALTLATGAEGWGYAAREPVQVVYIVGEAAHNVMRLHRPAWMRHRGRDSERPPFLVVDQMPLVATPGAFPELVEQMAAQGLKPGLVVLDTIARAMRGLDENNAKDAGLMVEAMDLIQKRFGCCVMALHHTGKDASRGSRGSNVMVADPDTAIEVTADRGLKIASVHVREQRAAEIAERPWTFQGTVQDRSLVFDPIDARRYYSLMEDRDAFSPKKIGAALTRLGAIGSVHSITTHALAVDLCPQIQGESDEERERSISAFSKKLRSDARLRLEAYHDDGRWFIPARLEAV